jgi:glycosyltransferase involved in cell wall biosynthesis
MDAGRTSFEIAIDGTEIMTQIWCAIPVYNNAGTIEDVARRSREQLTNVIVVDDGSTDANLRELLKDIDVTVIRHDVNRGKGAALLTAFQFAAEHGAEFVITIDGDGQHFPEDIPRFFPHLQSDAIVVGSREEVSGVMPAASAFGREFSDFWIHVETGRAVRDTQSGFRAYPVKPVLDLNLGSRHYNLEMELITRGIWAGLNVKSIPIRVWYPDRSERVSSFHPLRDNLRISLLHTRLVLRQLLPIPDRKLPLSDILKGNNSPLGLTAAVVISVIPAIVLWPWGWIAVVYLAVRLHLNKLMVLVAVALCMLPIIPRWCMNLGHLILPRGTNSHLECIVGAHAIALPAAAGSGLLVYFTAKRRQR